MTFGVTQRKRVKSPAIADEICRIVGINKRSREGSTTFSKDELQQILVYLKMPLHLTNEVSIIGIPQQDQNVRDTIDG